MSNHQLCTLKLPLDTCLIRVRKQLKIRPGFTPQEDVSRFRGTRQQQMDRNALPKGHILGWVAPSSESKPKASSSSCADGDKLLNKSAAKNAKRKAKKQAEKDKVILANWEDDDDVDLPKKSSSGTSKIGGNKEGEEESAQDKAQQNESSAGDQLAEELEKLDVK